VVVRGLCSAALAAALCSLGLSAPAFGAAAKPLPCAGLSAHRSHPAILSLDPRRRAPRVFAVQYKQDPRNVASYGSFRDKIECMLRTYVLGHLAGHRPNVVVFNEDIGLATLATGSRGAVAREFFARPDGPSCGTAAQPCGALGALASITAAYGGPLAVYRTRFPGMGGLSEGFVATTDTVVRSFMGTFSALARRHRLYMIGSGDLPSFTQSSAPADLLAFSDPDLHPRPASVYVATSSAVHNQAFMWGPRDVRSSGPDVMRNVVATNLKVPLTSLETLLGIVPGPATGTAAVANLEPYRLPGTRARIGFATSLPAFIYGTPARGVDPCSDVSQFYMRCLNKLGANLVIQDDANPGSWTGADGNGIEQWQPMSWMGSTYRTVSDPSVRFDYNVTAMMVGNLADLPFDGQSAITQRGLRGRGCHYIGNGRFVAAEDQTVFKGDAGSRPRFLALAPWVAPDGPRATLREVGAALAPGSGSALEDDYLETAIVADLPIPVDRSRPDCAGARGHRRRS
jgi:hypothetical protein